MREPDEAELLAFLRRLRVVAGRRLAGDERAISIVTSAAIGARDLGWKPPDLIRLLLALELSDFHRREPSVAGSGVVWTFEPYVDETLVWVRVVEDGVGWRVISCHLSETTEESR